MRSKMVWTWVLVAMVVGAIAAGAAMAQEEGGGRGGGRGGWDPARMQEMMDQRMRESLGATEEEWAVLGPMVRTCQELSREVTGAGGGMGMMFGRGRRGGWGAGRGGPARPGPEGTQPEPSAVQKAMTELGQVLESETADADAIRVRLNALRAAREAVKQELDKAMAELREVVTVRQEAILVLMGVLD